MTQNLDAFSNTKQFEIVTIDDEFDEHNGTVTVTVLEGTNYNPALTANENSVSINIQDNDLPEISISPVDNLRINEGDEAQFLISSSASQLEDLTVQYRIDDSGRNIVGGAINSVEIESGLDEVLLSLPITDNDTYLML